MWWQKTSTFIYLFFSLSEPTFVSWPQYLKKRLYSCVCMFVFALDLFSYIYLKSNGSAVFYGKYWLFVREISMPRHAPDPRLLTTVNNERENVTKKMQLPQLLAILSDFHGQSWLMIQSVLLNVFECVCVCVVASFFECLHTVYVLWWRPCYGASPCITKWSSVFIFVFIYSCSFHFMVCTAVVVGIADTFF